MTNIVPGFLFSLILYIFSIGFIGVDNILSFSTTEIIILSIVSFFLGHFLKFFSNIHEKKAFKEWGGLSSIRFVNENDHHFTKEFKAELNRRIEEIFWNSKNDININGSNEKTRNISEIKEKERKQENFRLCYHLIMQENADPLVKITNATYGFLREIVTLAAIGIILLIPVFFKHFILLILNQYILSSHNFLQYSETILIYSLFLIISLIVVFPKSKKRMKRFSDYFGDIVYKNFFVWYNRNKK
jgi:hypothetical protein